MSGRRHTRRFHSALRTGHRRLDGPYETPMEGGGTGRRRGGRHQYLCAQNCSCTPCTNSHYGITIRSLHCPRCPLWLASARLIPIRREAPLCAYWTDHTGRSAEDIRRPAGKFLYLPVFFKANLDTGEPVHKSSERSVPWLASCRDVKWPVTVREYSA